MIHSVRSGWRDYSGTEADVYAGQGIEKVLQAGQVGNVHMDIYLPLRRYHRY